MLFDPRKRDNKCAVMEIYIYIYQHVLVYITPCVDHPLLFERQTELKMDALQLPDGSNQSPVLEKEIITARCCLEDFWLEFLLPFLRLNGKRRSNSA